MCENFITQRAVETGFLPPMNICADKGTVQHRSMQFTTAVIALANSDRLLTNLYLGQPVVRDHSANGLAQSITSAGMVNLATTLQSIATFVGALIIPTIKQKATYIAHQKNTWVSSPVWDCSPHPTFLVLILTIITTLNNRVGLRI